jgi:hypothetical protein
MGEVEPLPHLRREYIADGERSGLRATWHMESGRMVISLWRGEECVATSHLTPAEAGRLSSFLTSGLADLATAGRVSRGHRSHRVGRLAGMQPALGRLRKRTASVLASLAQRSGR